MAKPTISEAIPIYLDHLRSRRRATTTIRHRSISLYELSRVVGGNLLLWNVGARHIDEVFSLHPDWSAGTWNNRLSHYKGFFKWSRSRGFMHRDSDPVYGWTFLKLPNDEKMRIPVGEWPRLYSGATLPRDRMTLSLGLFMFLRSSEVRSIQLKHLRPDEPRPYIQVWRDKPDEWDNLPITRELDKELRKYLVWYSENLGNDPEFFLIPSSRVQAGANGFIKGSIQYDPTKPYAETHEIVKRILDLAGYPSNGEGNHTLRRSGARAYFDQLVSEGYDFALRRVQSMLGHKSQKDTEHYIGLREDKFERDKALAGKSMFPELDTNVVLLRREL